MAESDLGSIMITSEGKAINGWVDEINKKAHVVSISKEGESYAIEHIATQSYSAIPEDEEQKVDQP